MISKFIRYFGGGFLVLAVVAAAYGAIFAGPAQSEYTIKVAADGVSEKEAEKSRQYLEEFLDSCSWIEGKNSDKIVGKPTVELHKPIQYRQEAHGWDYELRFAFSVNNNAGSASGHRLEYFIWSNGWETIKNEGADFCGKRSQPQKNTFVQF